MDTTHPLARWIGAHMTKAEFSRRVGMSPSHLTLVLQRKRGVSLDIARKIEEVTGKEIGLTELNDGKIERDLPSTVAAE